MINEEAAKEESKQKNKKTKRAEGGGESDITGIEKKRVEEGKK